jgi:polysaccharide pyruvyl transferase CsaB
MSAMRALVSGYYGFLNLGDEAILAGLLVGFRQMAPETQITVLSAAPASTARMHGASAVHRAKPLAIWREMRMRRLFISGGGGLLQDSTSARSALYYLSLLRMARMAGAKTAVLAQSIGPIRRRAVRVLARRVLSNCDLITVRDEHSVRELEAIGVRGREFHVAADLSFLLPFRPQAAEGRPRIGVAVRPWGNQRLWVPTLSRALESAARQLQAQLVLLPMHRNLDFELCAAMREMISPRPDVLTAESPHEMLELVSACELVVAMRLHALIFAAITGVASVAISYDPKVEAFAQGASLPQGGSIPHLDPGGLEERIREAWGRREAEGPRLLELARERELSALTHIKLALALGSSK